MTTQDASVQWQLAGNSAEAYERYLVPKLFAPWAKHLIQATGVRPGERVLDVACGTGIVARSVVPYVGEQGQIAGLDRNAAMLEVAKTTTNGYRPAIEWRQGNAEQLPYADGSFDVVFCQQALQFFEQPLQALAEMRRVLVRDGRAALSVWRPVEQNPAFAILVDVLERHVGRAAARIMQSPFPAWSGDHLRDLVQRAGFGSVHLTIGLGGARYASTRDFLLEEMHSSPLAGPLGQLAEAAFEALHDDLHAALAPYRDDAGVITPMETYIVMARSA